MNRSILIVICDFLLVSLLVFSTPDITKVTDQDSPRNLKFEMATNQVDSDKDLTAVMRQALEEERRNREQLLGELTRTRESLNQQQALVSERERQVQSFQQQLETKDQESGRLTQERANLQQQFDASQTNLQALTEQLHSSSTDALLSKEKLAAMEAEAKKQADQAATRSSSSLICPRATWSCWRKSNNWRANSRSPSPKSVRPRNKLLACRRK